MTGHELLGKMLNEGSGERTIYCESEEIRVLWLCKFKEED